MHRFLYTLVARLDRTGPAAAAAITSTPSFPVHETLMLGAAGPRYIRELHPAAGVAGSQVQEGSRQELAAVHTVTLTSVLAPHLELHVRIEGLLSPGSSLREIQVNRRDHLFLISVIEVADSLCPRTTRAFIRDITLKPDGLPEGPYRVQVNGVERRFLLQKTADVALQD